ncbi:hypothetical protein Cgig2_032462 [Carnegiea gigantea]|uniref:TF-B3 domain-containing protein n=1 Tax=Carnegiea gigantea TaxID=171969 RepID=A0A9Q1QQI6_9CARY|nr:hypothetical protein Cgig2_032462 [Carnegiea gigantea]
MRSIIHVQYLHQIRLDQINFFSFIQLTVRTTIYGDRSISVRNFTEFLKEPRKERTDPELPMEKNKLYFFKFAIGDYLKERAKIPPLFLKKLAADTPNEATRATIKGVAGQWPITLRNTNNGTYLEDGWEKVVKDNFLGDHEFLLFRYDGDMCFNLQIFEKNGCERIKAPSASEEDKNQQKLFTESDGLESSSKPTDDREINAARSQSHPPPTQNPYFTVHVKEYHVKRIYIVRIPSSFCKKHFPVAGPRMVTLRNSEGEGWEVTAVVNQGSYCLCKGWRNFAEANNIKLGNQYTFELMSTNEMRVTENVKPSDIRVQATTSLKHISPETYKPHRSGHHCYTC